MIRQVDTHRIHLLAGDGSIRSYCLLDSFGWVVLSRHRGKIRKVGRFTDTARFRRWLEEQAAMRV